MRIDHAAGELMNHHGLIRMSDWMPVAGTPMRQLNCVTRDEL